MNEKLTLESAANWHVRQHAHLNGGAKFFGYIMRCVEQPRLSRFDRYDKKTRTSTSKWRVDGVEVADLGAAIAALNIPPVFTEAELVELAKASDEWQDLRRAWDYEMHSALTEKGAVVWDSGKCRLTDVGVAAIAALSGAA